MIITDLKKLSTLCIPVAATEQEDVFLALETEIRRHPNALGLSAPQIGIFQQAFVYYTMADVQHGVSPERTLVRVSNPMVISVDEPVVDSVEGCLSIPGVQCLVPRHSQIEVTDDISGRVVLTEEDAIVWQHESDHLVGLLMTDVGVVIPKDIGRNDPCYCGSGKKYKHCHWK